VEGAEDWLAGGVVGRPHGLDGSFHVHAARAALLVLGTIVRAGEREAEIVRRAGTDDRPILRLAGIDTREGADALRGIELLVPRAAAPPLEEDEWWAEDLVGCRVVDGERALGRVVRLVPLPSCEALEVEPADAAGSAGGAASGGGRGGATGAVGAPGPGGTGGAGGEPRAGGTGGAGGEPRAGGARGPRGPRGEARAPFLVPLVRDAVRRVDVAAKLIDVDVAFLGDTVPEAVRGGRPDLTEAR
jgi:16S rRNA processing protein RimM